MDNQDFILRGEHLLKSPCEDKKKVLHPRTCSDQVLMEHDATSETSLFSWITTPLNPLAPDNEICPSLIEWLQTYYPISGEDVLPLMTTTRRGGAKLGDYLTINTTTEKLSVNLTELSEALWEELPIATYSKVGVIMADQNNFEINAAGKLSLKSATRDSFGGIKLSTTNVLSDIHAVPNNGRCQVFPIGKASDGRAGVIIPDSYLSTGYELPEAGADTLGGIMLGYTSADGRDYALKVDSDGRAYVHVPWVAGGGTTISVTGTNLDVVHEGNNYDVQLYELDKDTLGGGRLIKDADTTEIETAKVFREIGNIDTTRYNEFITDVQAVTNPSNDTPGYLIAKVPMYVDFNSKFFFKFNGGLTEYNGSAATDDSFVDFQSEIDKCANQKKTAIITIIGTGKTTDSGTYNLSLDTLMRYLTNRLYNISQSIEVYILWYGEANRIDAFRIPADVLSGGVVAGRTHVMVEDSFPGLVYYSSPDYYVELLPSGSHVVNEATKYFLYQYKFTFVPHAPYQHNSFNNIVTISAYKTIDDYATLFPFS